MRSLLRNLMRGSSSGAPRRRSTYERMRTVLRDWDVLFAELGAQVAGRTTRIRSAYARTAVRFGSQRHQAEQELAALRDGSVEDPPPRPAAPPGPQTQPLRHAR